MSVSDRLSAAYAIKDEWRRAEALYNLVPYLPDNLKPEAWRDALAAAHAIRRRRRRPEPSRQRRIDPKLLEILVCPLTKGPLRYEPKQQELVSEEAGLAYPIRDGIPIMLVDEARPLEEPDRRQLASGQPRSD